MTPTTEPSAAPLPSRRAEAITGAGVVVVVAALGVMAWQDQPLRTLLLLLLPACMNTLTRRWWPLLVAVVYFGVGNIELPWVMARFFPESGVSAVGFFAVAVLTGLQALPFWVYRSDVSPVQRAGRMALALALLTALPGIGWVAWRNPLLVAGQLFPATGIGGLIATVALFGLLASGLPTPPRARRAYLGASALLAGLAVVALWHDQGAAQQRAMGAPGWYAMNTQIPPEQARDPFVVRRTLPGDVIAHDAQDAMRLGADVVVFPESVLAPGTLADQVALLTTLDHAKRTGVVLLIGQTEALHPEYGAPAWRNTLRAYGAADGVVSESRLPMPVGNWKLRGGVPGRPLASDLTTLATRRGARKIAVSICFEDTVIWPHWGLLTQRPDLLVSVGNAWATRGSRGDVAQTISIRLLARLAGVPLVRATNIWERS